MELLGQNRGGKTIIFANFLATIGRLSQFLEEAGIAHTIFSGAQSMLEKQMAVDRFQHAGSGTDLHRFGRRGA